MKMCKRLFAFLLLLTIIANFLVMQAFAHRSVLYAPAPNFKKILTSPLECDIIS